MEILFFCRHDHLDGDILGNFVSSKRPPHKSKPVQTVLAESPAGAPAWEKKDKLQPSEPSLDTKRVGEKFRTKSSLIVRGLMAGPTTSCTQVVALSCFVSGKWELAWVCVCELCSPRQLAYVIASGRDTEGALPGSSKDQQHSHRHCRCQHRRHSESFVLL